MAGGRRRFAAEAVVVWCGLTTAGHAEARGQGEQALRSVFETEGVRVVQDSIWEANATAVASDGGVVLIDTFMLRSFTGCFRDRALRDLGRDSVLLVVNTHGHDDHTWGNQLFGAERVVGHRNTVTYMERRIREMDRFLERAPTVVARLRDSLSIPGLPGDRKAEMEARARGLETNLARHGDVRVTPPGRGIAGDTVLVVGGLSVELLDVSPAHTPGDVAVHVPSARLLVVGDLLRVDGLTGLDPETGDVEGWIRALLRLAAFARERGVEHVVAGHGPVGTPADLDRALDYWRSVVAAVDRSLAEGLGEAAVVAEVPVPDFAVHPDAARMHEANVRAVFAQRQR